MATTTSTESDPARWVARFFLLAFGAAGLWCVAQVLTVLASAASVRHWVATPAQLLSWEVVSVRGAGNGNAMRPISRSVTVLARYQYTAGGRLQTGTRVGLAGFLSELNDETRDATIDRLRRSEADGGRLTVYVNPQAPDQAVVNPALPVKVVLGAACFAGVCSLWLSVLYGQLLQGLQRLTGRPLARYQMALTGLLHGGLLWPIAWLAPAWPRDVATGLMTGFLLLLFVGGLVGGVRLWRESGG